jgi:hypothetical protein
MQALFSEESVASTGNDLMLQHTWRRMLLHPGHSNHLLGLSDWTFSWLPE